MFYGANSTAHNKNSINIETAPDIITHFPISKCSSEIISSLQQLI